MTKPKKRAGHTSSSRTTAASVDDGRLDPLPLKSGSLVSRAAIDEVAERLSRISVAVILEELLALARTRFELIESLVDAADCVIRGRPDAVVRYRLLLARPVNAAPLMDHPTLLAGLSFDTESRPTLLDGDVLMRLSIALVRASRDSSEADAFTHALGAALEPFFLLEHVERALQRVERGASDALNLLITAWQTAKLEDFSGEDVIFKSPVRNGEDLGKWGAVWSCLGSGHKWISMIDRFAPPYMILSISNRTACPGEKITIHGVNFGHAGRVYFPTPEADDPAFKNNAGADGLLAGVEAVRWSATQIEVVVPPWATPGELHLNAFQRHVDLCTTVDIYRLGNSILFEGGLARVIEMFINGEPVPGDPPKLPNLRPNDAVALSWRARAGDAVQVAARLVDESGNTLWSRANLPGGFGATVMEVPDVTPQQPTRVFIELSAVGPCGAAEPLRVPAVISVPPILTIDWIEVTQGVQLDRDSVAAGQSIPIVANKDTAVRLHLRCDRGGWFANIAEKITGSLRLDGYYLLMPLNAGQVSVASRSYDDIPLTTVNFVIPAAWCTPGPHRLEAVVTCPDPSGRVTTGLQIAWTWFAKTPMPVRTIYIGLYPNQQEMLQFACDALDYLPTPLTGIGIASRLWFWKDSYDLNSQDGWNQLVDDLEDEWGDADEITGVRWLGMIASAAITGLTTGIRGNAPVPGTVCVAAGDNPRAAAHELSHTYGLHHVNQPPGGPSGPYDAVDNGGLLRRPAWDLRNSVAVDLPAGDLMSYMPSGWTGITTWQRLFGMSF